MFKGNNLSTHITAFSLLAATPALSDAQSTKILEEYIDTLKSSPIELVVGDKEDANKYTQWNNIILKSTGGEAQIVIPWVKVNKKLLGGHEMTVSEKIDGVFQSPDPKVLEPIKFAIESKGLIAKIDGKEGAREYASSFDEVTFRTLGHGQISILMKMTDGTGAQVLEAGENGKSSGSFAIGDVAIDYNLDIEGQSMASSTFMEDFAGNFIVPFYKSYDADKPTSFFDPTRDLLLKYSMGTGKTKMTVAGSPIGAVKVDATFGGGTGLFGVKDSIGILDGETRNITYDVNAPGMGFPPVQLGISDASAKIAIPLDNTKESKPAGYKLALNGINLSEQLWNMFDPNSLLPRENIDLDIDLEARLRWLKKIAEIDVENPEATPPFVVDSAKIKALNLKIAGAELETTGSASVDNSAFPPVPDGSVNISIKGGKTLIGNLAEIGLIPKPNALAILGMSAMFFEQGSDDGDHLISTIMMTKDGHITANGMPLK